jgi:DNA-binding NarL/FixJ family response regulator
MTRHTALICEDDQATRVSIGAVLNTTGYTVVAETALGSEALQLALAHQPAVIILDLKLLGMSGRLLLPRLLEAAPQTSIIVYTADDSARQADDLAQAVAVIDKSHPEGLASVLHRLAGRGRGNEAWNAGSVGDILTRLLDGDTPAES